MAWLRWPSIRLKLLSLVVARAILARMTASLVHATLLRLDPGWRMASHRHDGMHELIVVLSGRIRTAIAGAILDGGAGSALHYPAGTAHAEAAQGGRPLLTVCIGWTGDAPAAPLLAADGRGRLGESARWLAELSAAGDPQARSVADGLLRAMRHELLRGDGGLRSGDLLGRVQAWAAPRLAQRIALADLAGAAGLSVFHFVRAFRAAVGTTPARWLRLQRVQAARTLLLTTDRPLRAIAPEVGFADEFQLSRVFRRETGTAPSRLRGAAGGRTPASAGADAR